MSKTYTLNRRDFLTKTAIAGVGTTLGSLPLLTSCSNSSNNRNEKRTPLRTFDSIYIPDLPDKAIDGKPLNAALIGCGSRGTGAAFNFLDAGNGLSIIACADVFHDKIDDCRALLKKQYGTEIPDEMCFTGFDAYKKACDLPVDLVLIASPNCFHPEQVKYAIEKGKHVFVEKPAAIDPKGYRTFIMALRQAKAKGLNVITGANYHYSRAFLEAYKHIQEGYLGRIISGSVIYNASNEQYLRHKKEWTDMEYMIRGHYNWNWVNGDQVSNLLVHWIDVFMWFTHLKPIKVSAVGSRIRRIVGTVYDNFSMEFEFENGVNLFGMVRRMDGCDNMVGSVIKGDKAAWHSYDMSIRDFEGNILWQYDEETANTQHKNNDMYILEHIDLINHIRSNKVIDIAEVTANSALACVMARESAYTGKICTWEQMLVSELDMMPKDLSLNADMSAYKTIPLPGMPIAVNQS
ncbi:Gfo/Idh/MocA family oxidoreductase [uncultured Parabacteroides sp.]|uniref:Gfo/Idh/MocA family protein n=1 Tax=uncultured Parabacteroides sp. TaxID=512312 RepID=UPI00259B92B4|nr:Gfo/Idh/MocA family oxidoreductase [uncultured Parabacteroides sp.]